MSINDLAWGTAEIVEASFKVLEAGGNKVNTLFIVIGFIACSIWIKQMMNHAKEAK